MSKSTIAIILILITAAILYFSFSYQSDNLPTEQFLKETYTSQINRNNENAINEFGPMVKKNEKVEIISFKLNECKTVEEYKADIFCSVTAELKTPKNGIQKTNINLYLKTVKDSFKLINQKQV